ncbi:MAG: alpha/beta hydrolase-fold protein [Planctomycetota bacterium]
MGARGQVRIETLVSEALRDNPLGDPHERPLAVYLPPGYETSGERYPVVYVLAPYTGTGLDLLQGSAWSPGLAERLDRLIGEQHMAPVIAVIPHVFTRLGGSQYLNSPAVGRYEDYIAAEVIPYVDAAFRTHAHPRARAVTGRSSGGYGALRLAMRRPQLFAAVACHSPDCYFEYAYKPSLPRAYEVLRRRGGVKAFLASFNCCGEKKSDSDIETLSVLAMAAAYSPSASAPLGFELPFHEETGELRGDVWEKWLENDLVVLVEKHAGTLSSLRLLFLDCGNRDEYHLQIGTRILSKKLHQLGIPHRYDEYDDTHRSTSYRFNVSLPLLATAIRQLRNAP